MPLGAQYSTMHTYICGIIGWSHTKSHWKPFLLFSRRRQNASFPFLLATILALISSLRILPSFLPSPDHWRAAFASLPSNSFATRQLQPPCHGNDLCLRLYCRSEPHMINQMANSHCIHCQHCPSTRHCRHWPHMHA